MELALTHRALANRQVDVIAGNATDGLIETLGLVQLEDDRKYFPPYEAVPVIRRDALGREPALGRALDRIAGRITNTEMRRMNLAVDGEKRSPRDVAAAFLAGLTP
jgi:glycine betaine/choline ABC-type transport system substrate-binding protein